MSKNSYYESFYGSLYLVKRGGASDPEAKHEDVIETYEHGRSHIDVAKELWSLAGDENKVNAISAVVRRAFGRDDPVLYTADIEELLRLLNGLDDALKRTILDADLNIRPEQLARIREHTRLIDIDEGCGKLASGAVWEGLTRVWALRNILQEAWDRGLDIALD